MSTVISVEHLSKSYRLGQIGTGTFSRDLELWWARLHGKPNPLLRIGQKDLGNINGKDLWALHDINFTVKQGEVLGIIGKNGAGKSTLLKILSRVTAPTSGKIKVKGRVASLLEVGTGFHPELTGRENIYLNGAILGMSRKEIERKFDEIVDFAEVEKFVDTPVKRYSSGMYVRLAFAVAAHLEPEILVVDEVLAVGDAEFQKKCLGKMGDVAKEGRTVLFVSHNIESIKVLCNRGILLDQGTVNSFGNIHETAQKYLDLGRISKRNQNPTSLLDEAYIKGSREVKIIGIGIRDSEQNYKQIYKIGEPLFIEYQIENVYDNAKNINCWFSFSTVDGRKLGTSIQYDNIGDEIIIAGKSILGLTAKFDDNIFSPGQYYLTVGILGKHREILDWCENVISVDIEKSFWKNKMPFDNRQGVLAFRASCSKSDYE